MFAALMMASVSEARVFDMNTESFATYLRGQYALAMQKDTAFAPSSGTGSVFTDEYKTNLAYEFGFVYASKIVNWRFGFEILKPSDLKEVKGSSAGGTEYFSLSNSISGYAPKIGLEFNIKKWGQSRLFANLDIGQATVTVQNSYVMTTAGNTQFPTPGADFREEVVGTGNLIESAVGFETLLSDTSTVVFDAGYRTLEVGSFKHNTTANTFQGNVVKGDAALNADGSARTLSLSGAFASVILRIWIK